MVLIPRAATATQDGGPTYFQGSAAALSNSSTSYFGQATSTTQGSEANFRSTSQSLASCTFSAAMDGTAGAGASYDFYLLTESTGFGSTGTQNCNDNIGNMETSALLCQVTGTTAVSCTASVSPTIAANTCFQLKIVPTGTPTARGLLWSLNCLDASSPADGIWGMTAANTAGTASTSYLGLGQTTSSTGQTGMFPLGTAVASCLGQVSMDTPPDTGAGTQQWDLAIRRTNAALATSETCGSAAMTTGSTLCSVSEANTTCSFGQTAVTTQAGGCLGLVMTATNTPATNAGYNYSLDCTSDSGAPYQTGGMYRAINASATATGTFYTGTSTSGVGWSTTQANNLTVNAGPLVSQCSGTFMVQTVSAATTWALSVAYSTTALTADTTKKCSDLTYTNSGTLCTIAAGKNSCTFAATNLPILKDGCFQEVWTASGTMTNPVQVSGALQCVNAAPTPTPTPTPTATPTPTPTPTPTLTPTPTPTITPHVFVLMVD